MNRYRLATIVIAGLAFFIGAVLGAYYTSHPSAEDRLTVYTCGPHGGLAEALGVGLGTNQRLGVECRDGYSFSINVEGPSLPLVSR